VANRKWVDAGAASDLRDRPVTRVEVEGMALALSWADGVFAAVDATATHAPERDIVRQAGPLRVVGISTTVMNRDTPRYSTSEPLLGVAPDHAASAIGGLVFTVGSVVAVLIGLPWIAPTPSRY
jgi:hypothetical protein